MVMKFMAIVKKDILDHFVKFAIQMLKFGMKNMEWLDQINASNVNKMKLKQRLLLYLSLFQFIYSLALSEIILMELS